MSDTTLANLEAAIAAHVTDEIGPHAHVTDWALAWGGLDISETPAARPLGFVTSDSSQWACAGLLEYAATAIHADLIAED